MKRIIATFAIVIAMCIALVMMSIVSASSVVDPHPITMDCTILGETASRPLSWESGQQRVFEDSGLLDLLKTKGGNCAVEWSTAIDFVLNSSEGIIILDGASRSNGNGLTTLHGKRLEIRYKAETVANGFDLFVTSVASTATPTATPEPSATSIPAITHQIFFPVAEKEVLYWTPPTPPAALPWYQRGWGVCWYGKEVEMGWDTSKQLLFMNNMDEARVWNQAHEVTCMVKSYSVYGFLQIRGQEIQMREGEIRVEEFPVNDPSLGLSVIFR